jgi:hypothetical protein
MYKELIEADVVRLCKGFVVLNDEHEYITIDNFLTGNYYVYKITFDSGEDHNGKCVFCKKVDTGFLVSFFQNNCCSPSLYPDVVDIFTDDKQLTEQRCKKIFNRYKSYQEDLIKIIKFFEKNKCVKSTLTISLDDNCIYIHDKHNEIIAGSPIDFRYFKDLCAANDLIKETCNKNLCNTERIIIL